jgi:hypothetical protein
MLAILSQRELFSQSDVNSLKDMRASVTSRLLEAPTAGHPSCRDTVTSKCRTLRHFRLARPEPLRTPGRRLSVCLGLHDSLDVQGVSGLACVLHTY